MPAASPRNPRARARADHPYQAFWEPLESDHGFELKPMFGGRAAYLDKRLVLHFTAKEEPWRGVLVATDHERQSSLIAEFPALAPHPVLPKWLYLQEEHEQFERVLGRLVALVKARDPRIGVAPSRRRRSPASRFRPDQIGVRSPEAPGRQERRVSLAEYEAVRTALEGRIPAKGAGVGVDGLLEVLAAGPLRTRFGSRSALARWIRVVTGDLEVRGVLRRRPGHGDPRWTQPR